ncbi:MAG TPA: transposase [Candidatus Peribacteraceae bacterium]|nr:transposase [Candidatus Peribacteraceae bacterium]
MRLARKVEVQPTPTQRQSLLQHAGNARWAYNWGLRRKQEAWAERKALIEAGVDPLNAPKVPTAIDLHRELNALKKLPAEAGGVPWMYEASKCAPQEALRALDIAFQHFFRRVKAGEKPGHPRFKKRSRGVGGFRLTGAITATAQRVDLPRIGRMRIKPGDHGYLPAGVYGQISVTERAGRWYVAVLGQDTVEATSNGGPEVGLDLGVVRLATLSDGTVFENPNALAAGQRKIKRIQKEVCRKQRGSSNRRKARTRLARAYARVANVRSNALHQATTAIAKRYSKVVIEDLRVRNMTRSARGTVDKPGKNVRAKAGLNRVVLDASFSEFSRMLKYKGALYGCKVVAVPPQYTSQRCSACGHTEAGNRRSQSEFVCASCGYEINADLNAAINILVAGSCPETINACGAGVRHSDPRIGTRPAMKQESAAEAVAGPFLTVSSNGE